MYTDISKEGTDEILERSMKNFRKNENDNKEASDVETDVRKHDVIEEVIIDEEEEVEEMELERLATRFSLFLDSFSIKRLVRRQLIFKNKKFHQEMKLSFLRNWEFWQNSLSHSLSVSLTLSLTHTHTFSHKHASTSTSTLKLFCDDLISLNNKHCT